MCTSFDSLCQPLEIRKGADSDPLKQTICSVRTIDARIVLPADLSSPRSSTAKTLSDRLKAV